MCHRGLRRIHTSYTAETERGREQRATQGQRRELQYCVCVLIQVQWSGYCVDPAVTPLLTSCVGVELVKGSASVESAMSPNKGQPYRQVIQARTLIAPKRFGLKLITGGFG